MMSFLPTMHSKPSTTIFQGKRLLLPRWKKARHLVLFVAKRVSAAAAGRRRRPSSSRSCSSTKPFFALLLLLLLLLVVCDALMSVTNLCRLPFVCNAFLSYFYNCFNSINVSLPLGLHLRKHDLYQFDKV